MIEALDLAGICCTPTHRRCMNMRRETIAVLERDGLAPQDPRDPSSSTLDVSPCLAVRMAPRCYTGASIKILGHAPSRKTVVGELIVCVRCVFL